VSGQLGINPSTLKLVKGGIEEEAKQAMENLNQILAAAKTTFKVK